MKLKFIYQPEGSEAPDWVVEFDNEKPRLTAGEAVWLERHAGDKPLTEVFEACGEGHVTSMLAILFVYRKRDEPTLRYGDFEDSIVTDDLLVEADEPIDEGDGAPKDQLAAEAPGHTGDTEPSPPTS